MCKNLQNNKRSFGIAESDCELKPYKIVINGCDCKAGIQMCPHCQGLRNESQKVRVNSLYKSGVSFSIVKKDLVQAVA